MREQMEQRFKEVQIPEFRERARTDVVRWVFSKQWIWSYQDLRRGPDEGILPGPEGAYFACGYNSAEQPIVLIEFEMREVVSPEGEAAPRVPTKDALVEEFISHQGSTLDTARFVRGELKDVQRLTFQDRTLIESLVRREDGLYAHHRTHYEGGRTKLEQCLSDNGSVVFEITYGPNGEQRFFRVRRDGTRFELGQPLPKGVTLKSLKATVRARLIALIPQLVLSAGIREPIYCVSLAYDNEGNDPLPPLIGIGLESERRNWQSQHGKKARDYVWNPAEFTHFEKPYTQLEDEALEEACDYLNSKAAETGSPASAIKLLLEVATELNNLSWPEEILRTPDFLVYAVDLEQGDLRKNLRKFLSPENLRELKNKGLL
jgi:hypothetical protein